MLGPLTQGRALGLSHQNIATAIGNRARPCMGACRGWLGLTLLHAITPNKTSECRMSAK